MCAAGGANAADQHGERKEAGIQDDVAEVRLGVRAGVALHVAEVRLGFQDQVVQHAWYQNQVPGPGSAACMVPEPGSRTRFCSMRGFQDQVLRNRGSSLAFRGLCAALYPGV